MSSTSEINFNDIVIRIADVLRRSTFLFPNSVGGDGDAEDLVKQIIEYDLAIAQDVVEGEGPPHIFVREAPNPVVNDSQSGRDTRDVRGARELELEFWAVVIVNEPEFAESQTTRFNITKAIGDTLGRNKRLLDKDGLDPKAMELTYIPTPFTLLQTKEKNVQGKTVVIRLKSMVNLRP